MGVKISVDEAAKIVVAELNGEIDHHSAYEMREKIDNAVINFKPNCLHLDFGCVKFMDSSGIGLILGRFKHTKSLGCEMKICNLSNRNKRMVRLAGVETLGIPINK
ncbi:MAG: STAS domain-containing protein [Oscillospiraceae bacterium]|jgi:stage II sporulation protein AA (anti-sigma F factor antagonist)|nr:STAS domain-containing protein [Oscillospiraceae bacterium]